MKLYLDRIFRLDLAPLDPNKRKRMIRLKAAFVTPEPMDELRCTREEAVGF